MIYISKELSSIYTILLVQTQLKVLNLIPNYIGIFTDPVSKYPDLDLDIHHVDK